MTALLQNLHNIVIFNDILTKKNLNILLLD